MLYAKVGGQDNDGYDEIDSITQVKTLIGIFSDMEEVLPEVHQELSTVHEELKVSGSPGLRQGRPVVLFEKLDRYRELVERAAELEKSVG